MTHEHTENGKTFRFNDLVVLEMLLGVPDEKRTGRLVQARKGCGQFGSNQFLVRLRDGSLMSFENVLIRHASDKQFEDAFYRNNGRTPPFVPEQAPQETDSETTEYSIRNGYPETGFVIDQPKQPETPGMFAMAITTG
jgi:hypothetical protein